MCKWIYENNCTMVGLTGLIRALFNGEGTSTVFLCKFSRKKQKGKQNGDVNVKY